MGKSKQATAFRARVEKAAAAAMPRESAAIWPAKPAPTEVRLDTVTENVLAARSQAVTKAWDALGRYKFEMFGYWASAFVKFNALLPKELQVANPFRDAVHLAREKAAAG